MKGKPGTNCTSSQRGQILSRAPESIKDFTCQQEMASIVSNTQTYRINIKFYLLQQFSWLLLGPLSLALNQCQMFSPALEMRSSWQRSTALSLPPHMHLLQTNKLPNNASGSSVLCLSTKSQILLPAVGKSTEHKPWSSILLLYPTRDETETMQAPIRGARRDMKH